MRNHPPDTSADGLRLNDMIFFLVSQSGKFKCRISRRGITLR